MCRTSSPPRRDLYELEQSITTEPTKSAADKGGFFVPRSKPGRIAGQDWMDKRPDAIAVWNASYTATGHRCQGFGKPWTVMGPDTFRTFTTHAEALAYALQEANK